MKSATLLAAVLVMASSPLRAADADDSRYRELVQRATNGDASIDFRALRFACVKASSCDPRGESKDLAAMHRAFQAKQYDQAAEAAEKLIHQGFVNIEAHAICAQAYAALKNADKARFHQNVVTGLIRSILATGDGKTRETAFEVVGTYEEYVILQVLGLPVLGSQSLLPGKPHSYDVQERDDPKTGQKLTVYFNIDAFFPPKGL